jgi:hypothetical protein
MYIMPGLRILIDTKLSSEFFSKTGCRKAIGFFCFKHPAADSLDITFMPLVYLYITLLIYYLTILIYKHKDLFGSAISPYIARSCLKESPSKATTL